MIMRKPHATMQVIHQPVGCRGLSSSAVWASGSWSCALSSLCGQWQPLVDAAAAAAVVVAVVAVVAAAAAAVAPQSRPVHGALRAGRAARQWCVLCRC
jgi:hypothetical protein